MTEEQIERAVERITDSLDRRFMSGVISQKKYDADMKELAQWADNQYRTATR